MTKSLFFMKKLQGLVNFQRNIFVTTRSLHRLIKLLVFSKKLCDNVIFLNIYENPSFCSTLFVFKNGILTLWLKLRFSSIKNSGLDVFCHKISRRTNSLLVILVKLIKTLQMMSILSRRLTANQ